MITSPIRGAVLSTCGLYRYRLWRAWDERRPRKLWCMLNPSTADADTDDATILAISDISKRLGFGGIEVVNLFAFRTPSPAALKAAGYPVGPENDATLRAMFAHNRSAIAGWGAHAPWSRVTAVEALIDPLDEDPFYFTALARNANGSPKHPLYVKRDTVPTHWSSACPPTP